MITAGVRRSPVSRPRPRGSWWPTDPARRLLAGALLAFRVPMAVLPLGLAPVRPSAALITALLVALNAGALTAIARGVGWGGWPLLLGFDLLFAYGSRLAIARWGDVPPSAFDGYLALTVALWVVLAGGTAGAAAAAAILLLDAVTATSLQLGALAWHAVVLAAGFLSPLVALRVLAATPEAATSSSVDVAAGNSVSHGDLRAGVFAVQKRASAFLDGAGASAPAFPAGAGASALLEGAGASASAFLEGVRAGREQERRETRRWLHDGIVQTFEAIRLTATHRPAAEAVAEIRTVAAQNATALRRTITEPPAPPGRLAEALSELAAAERLVGLHVEVEAVDLPTDLPAETVAALRDATAEALRNVRKHAGVAQCRLAARGDQTVVRVVVSDDGAGFDPRRRPPGFGLRDSVAGRLQDVGGGSTVSSEAGAGTRVLMWIER